MLNMLNLFFNKESSSEDPSDSGFETCTISQGDDGFFLEFSIKFYAGNEVIFWVLVELLLIYDNMITNSYQFSALEQKEYSLCELTQVFFTDCILRNDAVNLMSILLLRKALNHFCPQKCYQPI